MVILTLAKTTLIPHISVQYPFVFAVRFSYATATYWTSVFGAPSDIVSNSPTILDIFVNYVQQYASTSLAICLVTESSWYFDGTTLFIHFDHDTVPEGVIIQYGKGQGFTDSFVTYNGETEYLPLISDIPSIERSEDIAGYNRLSLLASSITLTNQFGILDDLKNEALIGNSALLSYVPNDALKDGAFQSSDIVPQAFYYVEAVENGREEIVLSLQDIRKLEKKVPTNTFDTTTYPYLASGNDGKLIPLVYGAVRSLPAIPITTEQTGTTSATYRCAEVMTAITTVRVKIDDTWTARTVSSVDLATGTFTIPNARSAAGSAPYDCQVDGVGIAVTNAPDIIVDLYKRYLDQDYTDQFYEVANWTARKAIVPTCGMVINSATDILDIIPMIQNGVYPSFRFDINTAGQKTIILDDRERAVDWKVSSVEIANIGELSVSEVSDYLAGSVTIKYNKDHTEDEYNSLTVSTNSSYVKENYQWSNTDERETLLTTEADAQVMADALAEEGKDPVRTIELVLMGDRFFGIGMYDIIQADTTMGRLESFTETFSGREFFGIIIGQVISVAPDYANRSNTIKVRLIDRSPETEQYVLWGTTQGSIVGTVSKTIIEV